MQDLAEEYNSFVFLSRNAHSIGTNINKLQRAFQLSSQLRFQQMELFAKQFLEQPSRTSTNTRMFRFQPCKRFVLFSILSLLNASDDLQTDHELQYEATISSHPRYQAIT